MFGPRVTGTDEPLVVPGTRYCCLRNHWRGQKRTIGPAGGVGLVSRPVQKILRREGLDAPSPMRRGSGAMVVKAIARAGAEERVPAPLVRWSTTSNRCAA